MSAFNSMRSLSPEALWQAVGNSNEKDASLWVFVLTFGTTSRRELEELRVHEGSYSENRSDKYEGLRWFEHLTL